MRTLILDSSLLSDGRLHVAVGDDCSVDFAVLHMQVQPAPPPTHTVTLTPVADAYVRGGSYADDNFGTASALETKEDSNASVVRESFLRWDLSGLSGRLLQAKVRLAGTGVGQAGNESCASLVSSDTWGESSLTFNNKPSSGKLFAQWLPVDGQAVEFSVTPQAAATLLGDKKLSLRIASTGDYGDSGNVSYASSENSTAANRPQLILSFEDTAPEIGHVANQTVSANTPTAALPFTVGDDYTAAGSLTVSGRSSNTNLVPNANLVFGGSGANRTVKVTPAANQSGSTTITLTVSDGTLTASDTFVLTVTAPPTAGGLAVTTMEDHYIDVDLWALASDAVTADGDLLFEVSNATNGAVTLLADGHTARFTPNTNVTGAAGFRYTVTDVGNDSRLFLHYSFEPPDTLADLRVTDNSGNGRTGTVEDLGTGDSYYSAAVPPALSPYSTIALKLTEAGAGNGSCFRRTITSAELNLNTHDWTFAGWFQRLSSTNNDFVFYLGGSDGFGGLGEELEVYCPANQDKLTLLHYNAANTSDANISSDPSVASNEWHHAAVTFNAGAGRLSLYLDGSLVGSETNLSLGFDQTSPVVFGGHNSSDAGVDRWFNGRLDDLAMFTDDLPASTVARLASRTVGHFGGLSATGAVAVTVAAVNDAPVLAAVSNRTIGAGQVLAITNAASDIDLPAQALTFSLLQNPTGAMLGASSGVLTWRPAVAQANSTNLFRVRVADNGTPTLSATQQFSVVVRPLVAAAVTQPAATDGLFRLTVAGDAGPDYAVQASTNFVDWSTIFTAVAPALPFSWTDTNAVNCMRRFYRARLGP